MQTVKLGVIGCGNISGIYFKNLRNTPGVEVVACADLDEQRARASAEAHGVGRACSVEALLADPGIQLVVNLTVPAAHAAVNLRALQAGKHAYCEKPYALSTAEAGPVLQAAQERDMRTGGAPDTFMGGGHQTCRKLLDDGWIGGPVSATAFMMCHGHESWHPNPEFYYQRGGGPMFDMGPYYLTALVNLLGPVRLVSAVTGKAFDTRMITSEPKFGTEIDVEIPTHIAAVLEFESGAIGTIVMSFDVWAHHLPSIEIYGTEGSMRVPDPNTFGGAPAVKRAGWTDWREFAPTHGATENSRGLGVADMAAAIRDGGAFRASSELAYHVLEIMEACHTAYDQKRCVQLESRCERPAPMPMVCQRDGLNTLGVLTRAARNARKAAK